MHLDYLALAAHPDDAEIFCAGLLIKMRQRGYRVGILDLTRGEAASNGTAEDRDRETAASNEVLQLAYRENLRLADGNVQDDPPTRRLVVDVVRRYQVKLLIAPLGPCRHPDHTAVSSLAHSVMFYAGNGGFPSDLPPWRPHRLLLHPEVREVTPSLIVDVSDQFADKMRALQCYETQFWSPERGETGTYIGSRLFHERWVARHRLNGASVGCEYGEAYVLDGPPRVDDPLQNALEG